MQSLFIIDELDELLGDTENYLEKEFKELDQYKLTIRRYEKSLEEVFQKYPNYIKDIIKLFNHNSEDIIIKYKNNRVFLTCPKNDWYQKTTYLFKITNEDSRGHAIRHLECSDCRFKNNFTHLIIKKKYEEQKLSFRLKMFFLRYTFHLFRNKHRNIAKC